MQSVVREINAEYDNKLAEIKNGTTYDVLEMSGSRAVWKEVLAVYSVKVNTDPDNPQEVMTMDDSKKQLLSDIFWEMNAISSRTESKPETVITETDDGHGNIVQTETTETRTYLYITFSLMFTSDHRSAHSSPMRSPVNSISSTPNLQKSVPSRRYTASRFCSSRESTRISLRVSFG